MVGVCLGEDESDVYCDLSSTNESGFGLYPDCEGNASACTELSCGEDCDSTCPPSYDDSVIRLTSNATGAASGTTVDLYSADTSSTPNAAVMTIPACVVTAGLGGNISDTNLEGANINVMFVMDHTASMSTAFDSGEGGVISRYGSMLDRQIGVVEDLAAIYADAELTARFGVSWFGGRHGSDADGDGVYSESELDDLTYDFGSGNTLRKTSPTLT